jgi:hypothetical protein
MSAFGLNPMSPGAARPINAPSQGTPYGAQSVSVGGQQRMVQAPAYGPPQSSAAMSLAERPLRHSQWTPAPANYRLAPDWDTHAQQQAAYKRQFDELAARAGSSPEAARKLAEWQQMSIDRDQQPMPGKWVSDISPLQERYNYNQARELDELLSKPQRPIRPGIDVPDANGMIMNSAGFMVPFRNHGAGGGAARSSPGAVRPEPAAQPAAPPSVADYNKSANRPKASGPIDSGSGVSLVSAGSSHYLKDNKTGARTPVYYANGRWNEFAPR